MGLYLFSILLLVNSFYLVTSDSLYDSSDPLLELYTDTFNDAVYGSKKAHFVEYYSSWCGACIGYAPTWKKFARHLSSWSPLVQVTVVNCADDKNLPLCREHSINSFPTLKYFPYLSKSKDDALLYSGNKHELGQLELDVAGLVQSDWNKQKPEGWPSFLPIENTESLDQIWNSAGSANFVGLLFQENPATMAWANVINFHKDKNVYLTFGRPQHNLAVQHLKDNANERFLLFAKGNVVPIWISPEGAKWVDIQEKVNELITSYSPAAAPAPVRVEPVLQESQGVAPMPVSLDLSQFQLQLVDLESTLSYMLYKEIARHAVIDGEDLAGLKQWTHTMKKYVPGTTPTRRLLFRLDEWLQLQNKVTAEEWTAKVEEIQQTLGNPISKEIRWMACAGSKSNLRGYTCGLWTLAHAISVEALKLEQNSPAFRPVIDVLEPFRQFITRFLSCGECAQNFAKEAEKHQMHLVTRPEDVVSWLWRVHNFVNKRLSGSASDDPKFPKQQFPPKAICDDCYDGNNEIIEEKAIAFVKTYYATIKTDPYKPAPGYNVNEYKDGKLQEVASRHLNPKFAVHAEKVDKLEAAERELKRELNANPQRQWRDIDGYENNTIAASRSHFYLIWLTVIGALLIFAYCKYRRNRSKFWKTFYYHNDFKLCSWNSETQKKYTA